MSWRKTVIEVALGKRPAELAVVGGKLVNVNTREIYPADIAMANGRIAILGDVSRAIGPDTEVIEAQGSYLVPGLIDAHMHTDSSMVTLTQLSRILLPRGVTTIMRAHEIENVLGVCGMQAVLRESQQVPLKVYFEAPPSVPWTAGLETTGEIFHIGQVREMLSWPETVSIGESDVIDPLSLDEEFLEKASAAALAGKRIDGHMPFADGSQMAALAAGAFQDDHENWSGEQLLAKARLGLWVMLREFSLPDLAKAVAGCSLDTRHMMLAIDDKLVHWLAREGGVDKTLKEYIAHGVDPLAAIQMATINTATYFRQDHDIGSLSPGRTGDLFLTASLQELNPTAVIANGRLVARDGKFLLDLPVYRYPQWAKDTIKIKQPLSAQDFEIRPGFLEGEVRARVLNMGELAKSFEVRTFPVRDGCLALDPGGPCRYIAVLERHGFDGNIALGIYDGIGPRRGAMATSISHDHHNITVVGSDPADMALAVNQLAAMGGGLAAAVDGRIAGCVPLDVAGLITEAPYEQVVEMFDQYDRVIRTDLGYPEETSVMTSYMVFNFIGFGGPGIPAGITDRGLVDFDQRQIVPLIV